MRGLVAVALASFLTACAQPPTKELEMAAARVEAARRFDAAVLAPEPFAEAETALERARDKLAGGARYRDAIRAAALASIRADEAAARARAERLVVTRRLDQLLFELEALLEMARAEDEETRVRLAQLGMRYENVVRLAESDRVLAAFAEASALKPELVELERSLRD
jgi:hypothetical protein